MPLRALVVLCCAFAFISCQNRSGDFNPGDAAPAFELTDLGGTVRSLENWRGKVIVLNFFASWCAPCREEMPGLERLFRELGSQDVIVVGVAVGDSAGSARQIAKEFSLTFPILPDPTGSIAHRYQTRGFPETFVIDARGRLVLFPDLAENQPVLRIVGPREWDTPRAKENLLRVRKSSAKGAA